MDLKPLHLLAAWRENTAFPGFLFLAIVFFGNSCTHSGEGNSLERRSSEIKNISLEEVAIQGELHDRIQRNFDRLEEPKYRPDSVFLTEEESGNWPGDTEGRTILGLVMNSRATNRPPVYLSQIVARIPQKLNSKGYMGPLYEGRMNEQQLSGNGWMLRGLCEYYEWKKDSAVLTIIKSIATNLFVHGMGHYKDYPIDPEARSPNAGAESGSIQGVKGNWMLSSDIGCVFIGMDGAIHAYKILRDPALKAAIDEMIDVFYLIDPNAIKAQTHATLSACRGLMRYAAITGERTHVEKAAAIWKLYKRHGMTENFENYNWFGRFDKWSEPCAIIDSYLLAVQLWQQTGEVGYLNDAESIYYNAICHTQRANGGFGCDNTPGNGIQDACLKVHVDEAHWCCTMRGAEGLAKAAEYTYFTDGYTLYIPFFHRSRLALPVGDETIELEQLTDFPFVGKVQFGILNDVSRRVRFMIRTPLGTANHKLAVNGQQVAAKMEGQFITFEKELEKGDRIDFDFDLDVRVVNDAVNPENTNADQFRIFWGPLMLGSENDEVAKLTEEDRIIQEAGKFKVEGKAIHLTPVYHFMDSKVSKDSLYKKQILF